VSQQSRLDSIKTARVGVLAGAAGGLAEVAWISLYAVASGADAAQVARGVSAAFGAGALAASVQLGIIIHMALAIVLGVVLAFGWRSLRSFVGRNEYVFVLAALSVVWFVNFFITLPLISPAFVDLLPFEVSLTSKLLFGWAAALVLRRSSRASRRVTGTMPTQEGSIDMTGTEQFTRITGTSRLARRRT
jgi:hypothetical protein